MPVPRQRLIAQIHIGKNQLGLDDETYRALLQRCTGKTSCSDMSFSQLHQVVELLRQQGFKNKGKLSPESRGRLNKSRIDKLRAIWITMGQTGFIDDASESALLHWVQGQLAKRNAEPIDALNWLDAHRECNRVLEQLKQWQERCERDARNADLKTISDATRAADQAGMGLDQAQIIQALLDHGVICWHALFESLGLAVQPHYTVNRQHLRPLQCVFAEAVCN